MKRLFISIFLTIWTVTIMAQNEVRKPLNIWEFFLSRQTYSEELSTTVELHERTEGLFTKQNNFLFRPAIDYHFNKNIESSIGYTFIQGYLNKEFNTRRVQFENNIWEQIMIKHEINNTALYHRFRVENRWIESFNTSVDSISETVNFIPTKSDYKNRFRYRIGGTMKLTNNKKHGFFVSAFDEIWINTNNQLKFTSLSRNWLYLGIGYELGKSSNIQLGYMHQRNFLNQFENTSILQFSIVKNLIFNNSKN